jgi:hypothetical protein
MNNRARRANLLMLRATGECQCGCGSGRSVAAVRSPERRVVGRSVRLAHRVAAAAATTRRMPDGAAED